MTDDITDDDNISVEKAMELYQQAVENANEAAVEQEAAEVSSALVHVGSSPEIVKSRLTDARLKLSSTQKIARDTKKLVESAIKRQQLEMEKKLAEMNAIVAPLEKQIHRLTDGIDAMNLYMGRDEYIVTIREGEKAPKDSPIIIRQRVLAMDEETALYAASGGMDAMDIDKFDQWLLEDPKHVQQIIPEEKSVVVLRVRASRKDYGDPWQSLVMDPANAETWWLIRNGDNLYRMVTEFQVGVNLVPKSDEFTALFEPYNSWTGEKYTIKVGSEEWLRAERVADAKTRHYMKIALILQGLVDRTEVFRPLPIENLSVIDDSFYEGGYVRVITDAELAIENPIQPFREWLKEKNSHIGVGTRVVFSAIQGNERDHRTITPRYASAPKKLTPYVVKKRIDDGEFAIVYPRTDRVWDNRWSSGDHVAQTSASYKFYVNDTYHLAIDYVTIEEMERYLTSRSQRQDYETMIPLMNMAIEFKKKEAADELDFRALLASELSKAGYEDSVDDLVFWWKTAHKWNRPLLGSQEDEAKAAKAILAEAKRRHNLGDTSEVIDMLRASYPDAMAIFQGNGKFSVVIPEVYDVLPRSASKNVFARWVDVTKTGIVKNDIRWTTVTKTKLTKLSVLYKTDEWTNWNVGADRDGFLTQTDIEPLVDKAIAIVRDELHLNPVIVAVRDYGTGWGKAPADVVVTVEHAPIEIEPPFHLSQGFPSLSSSTYRFYIDKKKGVANIFGTGYENKDFWRAKHNDLIDPMRDSGAPRAPWEEGNEQGIMWKDEDLLAREYEFATKYSKRKIEFALLDAKADRLIDGIVNAWIDVYHEKMYSRYIEDFGDDGGWEDFKAGKKNSVSFPYPKTVQKNNYDRSRVNNPATLRWLVMRLVESGNPPYGKTVQEAYKLAQLVVTDAEKVDLPDDIKNLRFLDEESNTVAKL
jgi:hypothetical protein